MTGDDPIRLEAQPAPAASAFDRLYEQRVVFLRGHLDESRADELIAELIGLDSWDDADVSLLIDSPDGSLRGALAVSDVIGAMTARVHTRCVGVAGPPAALLLASGTGSRSASASARVVLGPPRGAAEGTARDLGIEADEATRLRRRVAELLAERTGRPVDRVDADIDRDLWLSAEDARDYGLVDEAR